MGDIMDTRYFKAVQDDKKMEVSEVLREVYVALTEKGMMVLDRVLLCLAEAL